MDSALQLQKRIENLEARLSINAEGGYRPTNFEYETEVPIVSDLRVIGTQNEGSWAGALTWIEPQNKDIAGYEIWARNVNDQSGGWSKKGEVTQPPWSDNIITSDALTVQFSVRTKLRNGLGNTVTNSPTVPVSILAPSVSITDPSQVGPNVIGDSALVRTGGDKIVIQNADVGTLNASKITAGSLSAAVAVLGTVLAQQIIGTTISGVAFQTISGAASILISGGGLNSTDGSNNSCQLGNGILTFYRSGVPVIELDVFSSGGFITLSSSGGTANIVLSGSTGNIQTSGDLQITSATGELEMNSNTVINSSRAFVGTAVDVSGDVDFGDEVRHNGTLIINSSGAFVGAGVDVGANGVGCGGVNINGGHTGQTVTFNSFPTQMVFRGGVLTGYTP